MLPRSKRHLLAAPLLAAMLFAIAPAHAAVSGGTIPLERSGSYAQTLTFGSTASQAALVPSCHLAWHWDWSGYQRPDKSTYGTFHWFSTISCTKDMVFLYTTSQMKRLTPSTVYGGNPAACGVDHASALGSGCWSVRMEGTAYCNSCNGTWSMNANWQFRFNSLWAYLPYGGTNPQIVCTRTLNGKFTCNGSNLLVDTIS